MTARKTSPRPAALRRRRPLRLLHTSDLHLGAHDGRWRANGHRDPGLEMLERVVATALAERADVVVFAGDFFDSNRVRTEVVEAAAELLRRLPMPTVLLPGNHDCYSPDSVYRRFDLPAYHSALHLITSGEGEWLRFPGLDLAVWGRAHLSYSDSRPLRDVPPRGSERWQVAVAHGHLVRGDYDLGRSYQIYAHEIEASERDYVALGHWELMTDVSVGPVVAAYSGSPETTRHVLIVELGEGVRYRQRPL